MLVGNHDGGYVFPDAICLGSFYYEPSRHRRPSPLRDDARLPVPHRAVADRVAAALRRACPRRAVTARRSSTPATTSSSIPAARFEAFRNFADRRTITLGHRTGFVRQALIHTVPITPVVSVGAHETLFVLARGDKLARKLGLLAHPRRRRRRSGSASPSASAGAPSRTSRSRRRSSSRCWSRSACGRSSTTPTPTTNTSSARASSSSARACRKSRRGSTASADIR